MAETYFSDGCI